MKGDGNCRSGGIAGGGTLEVDRGAVAKLVNMYVNIKESDMGGEDGPGNSDRG